MSKCIKLAHGEEFIELHDKVRMCFKLNCGSVIIIGEVVDFGVESITVIDEYDNQLYTVNSDQIVDISVVNKFNAPDMVSHPPHYQSETGLEVIDVIEAFTFDLKGIEATDTGNIIKYICRWKHKNGLQDLEKAKWYLTHLINHVEKLEKENEK